MGCQEKTVSETPDTVEQKEAINEEEVMEEAPPVEEEEPAEEVQEEETDEETLEEEPVATPAEWQGNWMISAEPFTSGNLLIYKENAESFQFDIRTLAEQSSKELKSLVAVKDGSMATYEDTATGCVITFTLENERIQVKETEECEMPGVTVDFNHSFMLPKTFVMDENFVASIKEGKFAPDGFGIGDPLEAVEQKLGEPEAYTSQSGGLFRIYSDIGYGTDIYASDGTIGSLLVVRPEEVAPEEIKELLGEPVGEGISDLDGFYYLYYIIDDKYKLYFDFDPEDKTLLKFFMAEL